MFTHIPTSEQILFPTAVAKRRRRLLQVLVLMMIMETWSHYPETCRYEDWDALHAMLVYDRKVQNIQELEVNAGSLMWNLYLTDVLRAQNQETDFLIRVRTQKVINTPKANVDTHQRPHSAVSQEQDNIHETLEPQHGIIQAATRVVTTPLYEVILNILQQT